MPSYFGTPINNPIPSQWEPWVTQDNQGLEIRPHTIYDTATYVDNTTTELIFFTTNRATADLSNLPGNGQLPLPWSFLIRTPRLFFKYNAAAVGTTTAAQQFNDETLLTNTGIGQIKLGERTYGPWPLWMWPASSFVKPMIAGANSNFMSYGQLDGPLYDFDPPLMIAPGQPFSVTLRWPAGAVDLIGNVVLQIALEGQLAVSK